MTKEQLISLIEKEVPDGNLINIEAYVDGKRYFLNICGINDDTCIGVYNLCAHEIRGNYIKCMIDNSITFENNGYSMQNKQWF